MDLMGLTRMFGALALTVGLIVGMALIARRLGLVRTGPITSARRLSIIDQLWLDTGRTRLILVKLDNTEHLIVVTPGNAMTVSSGPVRQFPSAAPITFPAGTAP